MSISLAEWSLILLCFSMAAAIGGGLYEHVALTPMWSASPPASFAIVFARWTLWSWFREPLDVISLLCFLLALSSLNTTA